MTKLQAFIREFWPAFIPVGLLIVVALNQLYLYNIDYLNRWKGGGFGMFSIIQQRYFHVHLINNNALECAIPHADFKQSFRDITNYPDYLKLELLTKDLTQNVWVYDYNPEKKGPTSVRMIGKKESLTANDKLASFDAIEVQVFDASFNKDTYVLTPKLLRKLRYNKWFKK